MIDCREVAGGGEHHLAADGAQIGGRHRRSEQAAGRCEALERCYTSGAGSEVGGSRSESEEAVAIEAAGVRTIGEAEPGAGAGAVPDQPTDEAMISQAKHTRKKKRIMNSSGMVHTRQWDAQGRCIKLLTRM